MRPKGPRPDEIQSPHEMRCDQMRLDETKSEKFRSNEMK